MATTSLQRLLLYCTMCMLASAVLVTTIALLYHPRNSKEATMIYELEKKINCLRCSVGFEEHKGACSRCSKDSFSVTHIASNDCTLSEFQKQLLADNIKENIEINFPSAEQLKKLNEGHHLAKTFEHLSLNAPRPSAHWYMKHKSSRPKRETISSKMRKISDWIYHTGTELAHSQNGISNEHGQMKFDTSGFYEVYFQVEIRSDAFVNNRYKAQAVLTGQKGTHKHEILMQTEKSVQCAIKRHTSKVHNSTVTPSAAHAHGCGSVTLKGSSVHKILAGERIRIEVEMPGSSHIDTRMSRSFFGAMYFHKVPTVV